MTNNIGIYIHIPFCLKKCNYCDFYSVPNILELQEEYVESLICEIDSYKEKLKDRVVSSIYFGGGTPSLLTVANINKILNKIFEYNVLSDVEITLEANPETLSIEYLNDLYKTKVNRLSIGMQSMNNDILQKIGRIHSKEKFVEQYKNARTVGFNNISIDVMFGFDNQSIDDLKKTLTEVVDLKPEHISCYSLIIEENTQIYKDVQNGKFKIMDEDLQVQMYEFMCDFLDKFGYNRYEISNFSLPTFESKHNKSYWEDVEYIGFGASASSYFENRRYKNYADVKFYIKNKGIDCITEIEDLSLEDKISEFFFLGLRMDEGVSYKLFYDKFNKNIDDLFGNEIEKLITNNLITRVGDKLKLTKNGVNLSNYVFEHFLIC